MTPRLYTVTRWCCRSGLCVECRARGDLSKRHRVVHAENVLISTARRMLDGWKDFEPRMNPAGDLPDQGKTGSLYPPLPEKLEIKPCPCGCPKYLVWPLFGHVESSLYEREATELVKRWNEYGKTPCPQCQQIVELYGHAKLCPQNFKPEELRP